MVAVEAIKYADFGSYTGLKRGIFKILNDLNKPKKKEIAIGIQSIFSQVNDSDAVFEKDNELHKLNELEFDTNS